MADTSLVAIKKYTVLVQLKLGEIMTKNIAKTA